MKAQVKKVGNTIVVSVGGKIDYETQEPFKESLRKVATVAQSSALTDSTPTKVIFDMENLEFVGSSGITQFIQTLKDFGTHTDQKARILKASSEFKKVMRAYDDEETFEFSEENSQAVKRLIEQ
ncbi:MAG: STAS domain-containing protein [Cryobacterium sp.]|nr:STAS domain-containing protein [Oligoflexia bacterium]